MKIILSESQIRNLQNIIHEAVKRDFLPFADAREFAKKLNLKSKTEWGNYILLNKIPTNIPKQPNGYYNEWQGWGDFLGTGNISNRNISKQFLPFEEAREYVRKLNLKNDYEWSEYSKSGKKPTFIPSTPAKTYGDKYKGLGDWIGTFTMSSQQKNKIFWPFEKARDYVRTLNLKDTNDWRRYVHSGDKPKEIPIDPISAYKDEWKGLGDWLGTGAISDMYAKSQLFFSYDKAKEYAQSLNLSSRTDWREYLKSDEKPKEMPTNPPVTYSDEWISWGDFLGTGNLSPTNISKQFLPFEEARSFVRKLNLLTSTEWREYSRTKRPQQIPSTPSKAYENMGWINMYDWLVGSPYVTDKDFEREYLPLRKEHRWTSFEVAKEVAQQLGFETKEQWQLYIRTNRPKGLPYSPNKVYPVNWEGWDYFLGIN